MEDNTATIEACMKGYSPSLRHLPRHQQCALGTVHDVCFRDKDDDEARVRAKEQIEREYGVITLEHKVTDEHKGDMFTKEMPRVSLETKVKLIRMRNS